MNPEKTSGSANLIESLVDSGIKSLFKLITENPTLPIVMFVATEVVAGDEYGYWLGHIKSASVEKTYTTQNGSVHLYRDDIYDVLKEDFGWNWEDFINDQEAQATYDGLPWKEAIAVYIEPGMEA